EVIYVPVRRDEILPALLQGKGDVAAANLTITPEREQWVDFSTPLVRDASEIVVTGPASPEIRSVDGLAGPGVFVRLWSSYLQSTQYVKDATSQEEYAKLLRMIQVFQRYGAEYDFDWLMLAA